MTSKAKNQAAFSMLELLFAFVILGILGTFIRSSMPSPLKAVSSHLANNIRYARNLALTQNTIYSNKESASWLKGHAERNKTIDLDVLLSERPYIQMQFHLSGLYTESSFSIYLDTPRAEAKTTKYDGRPLAGDVIALSGLNLNCISGYNNNITETFCKNNSDTTQRLLEKYKVNFQISHQKSCKEAKTARIYFDQDGKALCGKKRVALSEDFVITLRYKDEISKICIHPNGQITSC
ncbi:MAG: type II secretion system protein [Helicobacter sp.]|nr:type II secretion system protein [Helicobacter sp.]